MAASTRSSRLSTSSGSTALGSILTERNSPDAVIVTVTSPPPAVPVTSVSASFCCAAASCRCSFMRSFMLGCPPGLMVESFAQAQASVRCPVSTSLAGRRSALWLGLADLLGAEGLGEHPDRLFLASLAHRGLVIHRFVARVEALVRRLGHAVVVRIERWLVR